MILVLQPVTILIGFGAVGLDILADVMDAVDGTETIWVTYRGGGNESELREFLQAIEADYHLCKTINYGNESVLQQYIQDALFAERCTN